MLTEHVRGHTWKDSAMKINTEDLISVTEASRQGVSKLVSEASAGRDLVLMPIRLDDLSAAARQKLSDPLVLALKRSRGAAPFDRPISFRPEDYETGGRVLVDMNASVSTELVNQISQLGGQVINGWQTATTLRAWVPFTQLEAVANLSGIQSMSAARPTMTHRLAH